VSSPYLWQCDCSRAFGNCFSSTCSKKNKNRARQYMSSMYYCHFSRWTLSSQFPLVSSSFNCSERETMDISWTFFWGGSPSCQQTISVKALPESTDLNNGLVSSFLHHPVRHEGSMAVACWWHSIVEAFKYHRGWATVKTEDNK